MTPIGEFAGRPSGNHWGDAICTLSTLFGEPYPFNLHIGDVGHTVLFGPTSSGKTTLQLFIASALMRRGARQVFFNYGVGHELLCYLTGGRSIDLVLGAPSGLNPFQMEPTPKNVLLATEIVRRLAAKNGPPLSPHDLHELEHAVKAVFALPKEVRRLARMLDYIDPSDLEGLHKRLARWVNDGPMAWLWDNPADTIDFDRPITGINIKDFIDNDEIRSEVMLYLFHRVEMALGHGRLVVHLGEFWKALDDPYFSNWIEGFLNLARKYDGLLFGETQFPDKAANSAISTVIIGQTATKIYLWNPTADEKSYVQQFGLSRIELAWVRTLGRNRMLVKQKDGTSIVLTLDLGGPHLDFVRAVLSVTPESVRMADALRKEYGVDPARWLPEWKRRMGIHDRRP
jgi:type IV secretion system protein VirB4